MANEKRLIMTEQEAIAKAEQELSTSRYIAECTRSPGMRAIHDKRCAWLSVIVWMAKKALNVDAVEVVHAKWENVQNGKGCCSNCHRLDGIDNLATHCRYCGAKMDGGNEDG